MVLSTEWSQVEVIDLVNDGNGLGFILVGGRSTGVVIKALTPGGVAERDGRLQCGDHLLQIGEVNLRGFSSEQVATVLRQTGAQVRLIVARPVEPAATDFQALASHAPIIPTKLLSDPEELSRHLFQNPSFATSTTTAAIAGAAISPSGGGSGGGIAGGGGGSGSVGAGLDASVGSGLCCFLPTPDAELADLPLPPIPSDVPASAARICPKDLDIVPFSIVSPPPTLSPLPLSKAAVTPPPPPSSSQPRSSNMDHIVTVIAGLSAGTPKDASYSLDDDGQEERRGSTTSSSDYNIDSPETETYEVTLYKNVYGLGITVAGYVCEEEDLSGIFVKSIIEGSAAEMSKQIQINDRIVAVDGRTLAGVTNHQAVELLRNTDIEVQLTLERFLRGRKFEHLQVALTELKGGIHDSGEGVDTQSQSSLPASPSIATLSWFPPKSDADSIATDGGGGGVSGALVIMDFGDLPSRETVDSNMSHMLDRSERSEHSAGGAITPNAKLQRTPAVTPDKHLLLANGNAVQFNGNGLPHDDDDDDDEDEDENDAEDDDDDVEHSEGDLETLQQPNGGAKTPTNENVITTATVPSIASPITAIATAATANTTKISTIPITTTNVTKLNVMSTTAATTVTAAAAAAAPAPAPTPSAESLKVTWKSLGISLEGTVDVECGIEKRPHHYIRSILEDGPVGRQGILRPGDELLQVNEYKLQGLKHIEVVKILKELPTHVKLVCARGPMAPSIINTSQNPEAFETRSLLPGGHQSLQNLMTKAQSESSLYTSSTATLTDQQRSKSLENVSGLALWSSDVTTIEIEKTEQGFGFSILDYQDPLDAEGSVIVIRGLIRGGSAEATNEIFPGDRLVSVGEHSLHGLDLDEAVAILKGMPLGITKLGICRPLSTSDSNIASPVDDAGDSPST